MDESYDVDIESKKGLNSWLAVWKEVLQLQNVTDIRTAREFDDHYPGMYSLQNWFDCFDNKLRHAGISDPQFYRVRISVSEEAIKRLGLRSASELDRWTERRRISMAASYFKLGETEKTDELYKKWLSANPTWGKGWGAWALNYSTDKPEQFDKAEQILKEGLAVKAVKGRNDLIDGLAGLYIKQDRLQDVSCMYEQLAYDDSDPDFEDEEYDDDDRALKEFWSDEALLSAMSELILTPK
jgi:tetratricopeptide (TPR) repeat protein